MKINKIFTSIFAVAALTLSSCEKSFEELEKDPNRPVNVPAALVLQGVESDMFNNIGRPFSAEMRWNQFYCSNYNYYANNEYTLGQMPNQYTTLKNVIQMEAEAKKAGLADVNGYSALGKFFRAYFFDQMSKRVGDLPMTEALKGISNTAPAYDSQKAIYVQILKWLDEANTDLATVIARGETVSGDFYFSGDLKKWQKAVNAYRLRVLVTLSKKDGDAELGVKAKFAEMVGNPSKYPLFVSNNESLQFVYNTFNKYPSNPDNFGFDATRQNMASTYVGLLTKLQDPRVMVTCEPAGSDLKAGKLPSDYTAYRGAGSGDALDDMSKNAGISNGAGFAPGIYSFQSRSRYYKNYTAENTFIAGYPEMCLNIAEAINRGWLTGSADSWYQKGVKAMFSFYGVVDGANTVSFLKGTAPGDYVNYTVNFSYTDYFNQEAVKYAGDNATGLNQILTQRYLSLARNSGYEGYYHWRRTGVPAFSAGAGTGNSGVIPLRFQYPSSEISTNKDNNAAAVASQFGGSDDINAKMWIIK